MTALLQPVQGRISSGFGVDRGDHSHKGIDIAAPCGTPVQAAAAGRVTSAHYSDTAGNMVIIDHGGGLDTRYFHLSRFAVRAGAQVAQGQVIGYVGSTGRSTGCHLHWEVRLNGQAINPLTAGTTSATRPPDVSGGTPDPRVYAPGGGPAAGGNNGAVTALLILFVGLLTVRIIRG